jgi:hypothetical protein
MEAVKQEKVIEWIIQQIGQDSVIPNNNLRDNRGPDLKLSINGLTYYFEAIQFNVTNKGKNQSDFWKAFAQSLSRLNPASPWRKTNIVVIALPYKFEEGWKSRVDIHGKDVWHRIGDAFPELEIWFVSPSSIKRYTWNEAFAPSWV